MNNPLSTLQIAAPQDEADRAWLTELWRSEWGGEVMISKGVTYHLADLPALIARAENKRVGAATYHIDGKACELLSINALTAGLGTGSALLAAVESAARAASCSRVWLITTNDNLNALAFYQKRGYRIRAVYPGAVDRARQDKPSIPLVSADGIPIHDELELEKPLI